MHKAQLLVLVSCLLHGSMVCGASLNITPNNMQPYALSVACDGINCVDSLPWFDKTVTIKPSDNWIGKAFGGYGYQFWTENESDRDAVYLSGANGQRIAISKERRRIMVAFSYKENFMHELYKLFSAW